MARVTSTEVKAIMADTDTLDATVNSFIAGANALVNSVFGTGTSDILTQIELWLSAHMIACSPIGRVAEREGAGGASITYTGKFDDNLGSTPYGQMVKILDTTGRMATLGNRAASTIAIKSFDE